MTRSVRNGLIVAALHVALTGSLGAKLLIDRVTRPRVWVRTAPFDPDLPIRGRYVRLRIEAVPGAGFDAPLSYDRPVDLAANGDRLVATPADDSPVHARISARDDVRIAAIAEPLAFFLPEHVVDPSVRGTGEELWVEVTVPRHGPPRPIRLGVRKNGRLAPLDLR